MSITSRINEIETHLKEDYTNLEALGYDIPQDKNIENIASVLDNAWENQSHIEETGTTLSMNTNKGKAKVDLLGNTYQETTSISGGDEYDSPSPDHPQPIQIVSGDNEISVCGKNLFAYGISAIDKTTTYKTNSSQRLSLTAGSNVNEVKFNYGSGSYCTGYFELANINGTLDYKISFNVKENTTQFTPNVIVDTTNSTTDKLVVQVSGANGSTIVTTSDYFILNNIQLEKGTTATTYEPYQGKSYPIYLGVENLFDKTIATYKDEYYKNDSGTETSSTISGYTPSYIAVKPNTTYTINGTFSTANVGGRVYFLDNSKSWISRTGAINNTSMPYTFTTPENCYYIQFQYVISVYDADTVQLTEGNHIQYITDNPLELCKIGDYQDYFYKNIVGALDYSSDRELGAWYLKKNIGKVVLDGSENWSSRTNNQGIKQFYCETDARDIINDDTKGQLSNIGTYLRTNFNWGFVGNFNIMVNSYKFYIGVDSELDLDTFKANINVNNIIVCYPLATPTYTKIEGTLASQLEDVWRANTYDNQTNVSQVNNDLPFELYFKALGTPSNTLLGLSRQLNEPLNEIEESGDLDGENQENI